LNSALLGVKPDAFMPAAILRNTHGGAGTLAGDAPVWIGYWSGGEAIVRRLLLDSAL
jgi:hypothetical protein